jgi:hypothetical protein
MMRDYQEGEPERSTNGWDWEWGIWLVKKNASSTIHVGDNCLLNFQSY